MLSHYGTVIAGLAAIVAGLVYLARQIAKLATLLKFVVDHPAEHERLAELTAANTAAIERLTEVLALDATPRGRRSRLWVPVST